MHSIMHANMPARLVLTIAEKFPAILRTLSAGTRSHCVPIVLLIADFKPRDETAVLEALVDETLRQGS
jgi:hypothetical protein